MSSHVSRAVDIRPRSPVIDCRDKGAKRTTGPTTERAIQHTAPRTTEHATEGAKQRPKQRPKQRVT
jgi:hypothetical protein